MDRTNSKSKLYVSYGSEAFQLPKSSSKKQQQQQQQTSSSKVTESSETTENEMNEGSCRTLCVFDETVDEENFEKCKNIFKKVFSKTSPINLPKRIVYYIAAGSKHDCGVVQIHYIGQEHSISVNVLNHLDSLLRTELGMYYALQPSVVPCFERDTDREQIKNPIEFSVCIGLYTQKYTVQHNISNPLLSGGGGIVQMNTSFTQDDRSEDSLSQFLPPLRKKRKFTPATTTTTAHPQWSSHSKF